MDRSVLTSLRKKALNKFLSNYQIKKSEDKRKADEGEKKKNKD